MEKEPEWTNWCAADLSLVARKPQFYPHYPTTSDRAWMDVSRSMQIMHGKWLKKTRPKDELLDSWFGCLIDHLSMFCGPTTYPEDLRFEVDDFLKDSYLRDEDEAVLDWIREFHNFFGYTGNIGDVEEARAYLNSKVMALFDQWVLHIRKMIPKYKKHYLEFGYD